MIVALIVTYFVKTSKKKETTIDTQEKSVNDGETQSDDSGVAHTPKRDETSTFNNEVEQDLPSFHPSILCDKDGWGDEDMERVERNRLARGGDYAAPLLDVPSGYHSGIDVHVCASATCSCASGDDHQGGIVFVPSKDEDDEMLPNTP